MATRQTRTSLSRARRWWWSSRARECLAATVSLLTGPRGDRDTIPSPPLAEASGAVPIDVRQYRVVTRRLLDEFHDRDPDYDPARHWWLVDTLAAQAIKDDDRDALQLLLSP